MAEQFTCITQINNSLSFKGPSGKRYMSYKGQYFIVDNVDVERFAKHPQRFERKGLLGKVKDVLVGKEVKVAESADVELAEWAESIDGVSKKSVKLLAESYNTKEDILGDLEQGFEIRSDIPQRTKTKIRESLGIAEDGGKLAED